MDQELTVSKNFISYLFNNLPSYKSNNTQKCIDLIEQNHFVNDLKNNHLKQFYEEFEKYPDSDKKRNIYSIMDYIFRNKIKYFDHNYSGNEECEESEELLAKETNDKILFDVSLNSKDIKRKLRKYPEIEYLNEKIFINPDIHYRFKVIPVTIELEADVRFDLNNLLFPLIRNSKEVKVIDPFLPNKNAFSNLKKLFEIINIETKIKLQVYSERDYLSYGKNNDDFKKNYGNFLNEIKKMQVSKFKIEIEEFKTRKHKERYIMTDKFEITLPGGLDCLNENGMPVLTGDEKKRISVNYKNSK